MYEIRAYKIGAQKTRIAKIKKTGDWFGFFAWMRLWFTLRALKRSREEKYRGIAADTQI